MNGKQGCGRCSALERERNESRAALARAREELEALRLAVSGIPEHAEAPFKGRALDTPLRYVIADKVNDGLKRWLKPVHAGGKALASGLSRRGRRHG